MCVTRERSQTERHEACSRCPLTETWAGTCDGPVRGSDAFAGLDILITHVRYTTRVSDLLADGAALGVTDGV